MGETAATTARYRPAGRIAGQFDEALRGLQIDSADRLWAVGDSSVKVFDREGKRLAGWGTAKPGFAVAVDADGGAWVGGWKQVERFDAEGRPAGVWRDPERMGLVTAIALGERDVFLADATARWIRRYDRDGAFVNNIGDRHRKGGFHIPNGVVDFALDEEGVLHVANPGMHRVERYRADGEPLGAFGRFGALDPTGFPGCCNPTNLALAGARRVVVTEKAPPRAKVYSSEGKLLGIVADEGFDPQAKNMDVAVDSAERVYVADTAALAILIFEPDPGEIAS